MLQCAVWTGHMTLLFHRSNNGSIVKYGHCLPWQSGCETCELPFNYKPHDVLSEMKCLIEDDKHADTAERRGKNTYRPKPHVYTAHTNIYI